MNKLRVFSSNKDTSKLFEKAFSSVKCKYHTSLNMGNVRDSYPVSFNKVSAINSCLDRLLRNSLVKHYAPTAQQLSSESQYSEGVIIKKRVKTKKNNLGEDSHVVESNKEAKVFNNIYGGGTFCEVKFNCTSEYLLICSDKKPIYSCKLRRKEKHASEVITNFKHYNFLSEFMKPKLWKKIEKSAVDCTSALGLELSCVKIGYSSAGDSHKYVVFSVSPELPFIPDSIPFLQEFITEALKEKEEKYSRLEASIRNKESFGKIQYAPKASISKEASYIEPPDFEDDSDMDDDTLYDEVEETNHNSNW